MSFGSALGTAWSKRPRFASLKRPLALAFVIALFVHLPLTPVFPILRMLSRLSALQDDKKDWDYKEQPQQDMTLPIELMDLPKVDPKPEEISDNSFAPPPEAAKPSPNDTTLADPTRTKAAGGKPPKADDAKGGDKKSPSTKFAAGSSKEDEDKPGDDAADPSLPKKKTKPKKDDPKTAEKPKDESAKKEKEVVGLNGTKDARVIGKPNVTLAMWLGPIRAHALGASVGEMFACNPEWKPFVAQGLKPLDDLEGLMVVGPQLSDTSKATVAVQHNLTQDKLHDAMDVMVKRGGPRGAWLRDDVAKVVLSRKERAIFPHPKDMIFMAPLDSWQSIHDVTDPLSLPPSNGRAVSLTLQKPSRPLKKLGLTLPERLVEMRLDVFANGDGSADMQIDFDDATEDNAKADAPKVSQTLSSFFSDLSSITQTVDSLSLVPGDTGTAKLKLPDVDFDPSGQRITSMIHFAPAQSARILSILGKVVCPKKKAAGK